jgi:glycosyltransferase involved in cell wall biosynthesis
MRILYASERPPYPFFLGGAARAAHMLLVRLAATPETTCEAVGASEYAVSAWRYPAAAEFATLGVRSVNEADAAIDCGYPIQLLPDFYRTLAAEIERFQPDLVWAQLEGALTVLQIANRLGVRGLCFVHDAEFDAEEMRQIAALDCHLVTSSRFLSEKVYRATGRRAAVVYPPAELYFDTQGDHDGLVTMINPHPVKGLDTFIEIARRLSAVNFLLQESWKLDDTALNALRQRLVSLPNVRFAHRVSDMRSVYRQTRLLIAPSRWEEGFGMVALEAQSCGIPVIASRRGGLSEAVGDGGLLIDDYLNADVWVNAIETLLNDVARYRAFSERARRHAASETFAPDALARRLHGIAQGAIKRPGLLAQTAFDLRRHARDWPLVGRLLRRLHG